MCVKCVCNDCNGHWLGDGFSRDDDPAALTQAGQATNLFAAARLNLDTVTHPCAKNSR